MPVKMWTKGVLVMTQHQTAQNNNKITKQPPQTMPFIYKWMAVMPDVHFGLGATIGSVIPTKGQLFLLPWV